MDEEYFACLIECLISGTTDLNKLYRKNIIKILKRKSKLKTRLDNAFVNDPEQPYFKIEPERIENVILKLAYGHAKFENSETIYNKPIQIGYAPLESLTNEELNLFFSVTTLEKAPEVGSRAMQNIYLTKDGVPIDNWITVQHGIYRYSVTPTIEHLKVRILIWNYLACEVIW